MQTLDINLTKIMTYFGRFGEVCVCVCVCVCVFVCVCVMSTESSTSLVASQQIDNEICWLPTFTHSS